jgi:hypothetical protein
LARGVKVLAAVFGAAVVLTLVVFFAVEVFRGVEGFLATGATSLFTA